MGYYTTHELEIKENRSELTYEEVRELTIRKLTELDVIDYALDENLESYDAVKWYEHKTNMAKLSTEVKDVLYMLSGEGEENCDMWKEYWINGMCHRCQAEIVYPEFDASKLVKYEKGGKL